MDEVQVLDVPWSIDAGAPTPVLFQTERDALVVFDSAHGASQPRVVVRFSRCVATHFGYPNDEALGGHPLYAAGLTFYAAHVVMNSSWKSTLQQRNQMTFPGSEPFRDAQHFVLTFHDSTFECLAGAMDGQLTSASLSELLADPIAAAGHEVRPDL